MMRLAEQLMAALLRALPGTYDTSDIANLMEMFGARSQAARAGGRIRYVTFVGRELGGMARVVIAERWRSRSTTRILAGVGRDLSHACRRLLQAPGFSATVLLTLSLAVGASAATFTVFYRLAIAPLPYPEPERLIAIDHDAPGIGRSSIGLSLGLYWEYSKLPSINAIALYYRGEQTISGAGDAERVPFLHTTTPMGDVLGIRPQIGRWFTADEGLPGAARVVFISHELWLRRFQGSAQAIGTTIRLDGVAHTVVGVAPSRFAFPDREVQYIVPLRIDSGSRRVAGFNYRGIARLAAGVTHDAAREEQRRVIAEIPQRFADQPEVTNALFANGSIASAMTPLNQRVIGETGKMLWLLAGGAIGMLLIAAANVANLMLVRTHSRRQELALRRALGASGRALARSVLAEVVVLSSMAAVLGTAVMALALAALVDSPSVDWPRRDEIAFDLATVAIAVAVSVALAGLVGAIQLLGSRGRGASGLAVNGRGNTDGIHVSRARGWLLSGQVALALVLLVMAGLLCRSAGRLGTVDVGFVAEGRLAFDIGLPRALYRSEAAAAAFNERLLANIRQLPGVRGAALTSNLPLEGLGQTNPLELYGDPAAGAGLTAGLRVVSPGYLEVAGIPLKRGRTFDGRDVNASDRVAVIDESLVRSFFRDLDPIGRRIRPSGDREWLTIIGVAGTTPAVSLREKAPANLFYVPAMGVFQTSVVVDAAVPPLSLLPALRQVLAAQDGTVALARPRRLTDVIARSNADVTVLGAAFGLAAIASVLLGAIGVYGVVASVVTARSAEIGIRLALGAQPGEAVRLVTAHAGVSVATGLGAGIVASLAMTQWIQSWLFEIAATDWPTYAAATLALATAAALACVPARRAATIDPLRAMRGQ